ncbi:hypothetical protein TH44_16120 [Thalassospira xiamenensis]|uniref:Uncharacterized protein n=1 Tax=Thalassospira xiamenensis TaxID=220697 RepID=A0A367X317_9PROT|nr:hypothetical protein TH44_16120 [Thalassospira xiamenensis]
MLAGSKPMAMFYDAVLYCAHLPDTDFAPTLQTAPSSATKKSFRCSATPKSTKSVTCFSPFPAKNGASRTPWK